MTDALGILYLLIFVMGITYGFAFGLIAGRISDRWSRRAVNWIWRKLYSEDFPETKQGRG